ncbi:hypothetical protein pEaSNUABM23_00255 [Erwinia phage pEa_SNUABM_23]|uniref:Uncharacterized protein n=1 Tax=Erwinia phage pEa_SNUABM_3 TaxID=2869552 RepID=A0AAE8BYN1_9CAUD|nr:hypothetical protein MPK68_gp257 [Erwinia phage pEa_SNUABM_3]QZE56454.1 hypothetical protein pEaSNUABM3_00257 [Erwinia phage pEa_SNUABM_3]UAW53037.1 hypothetical protein pEaSNUABM23_00255 [Erwinia phage pEa_SNUABM_23]UIW10932.1 hypothetical protein pEaSNUABM23_00255 [Erwinia phage pEa_SNUABM_31]
MRRFVLIFNVSQEELDDRRFFQAKLNIVSSLRRARCVFLVVRETKQVLCVSELTYQPSVEPGIRQVDFDAPRDVTAYVLPFTELTTAMVNNSQDPSIRYFGRQLEMDADQLKRFHTQLEIVP